MSYEEKVAHINKNKDYTAIVIGVGCAPRKELEFGEFIIGSYNERGEYPIGFVVQVRKGCGAFGSDVVLLRENDGTLSSHSNQAFWRIPSYQVRVIKEYFEHLADEELKDNPEMTYSIAGEREFSGFLITEDDYKDESTCTMAMVITKEKEDE